MKRIAIVGAGNAGCVTALELLKKHLYYRYKSEIIIYHDSKQHPIEKVGQGSLPGFPILLSHILGMNWYDKNHVDGTIKTGILYEGWGKKQYEIFHPFEMHTIAVHFDPNKLSKAILESNLVNVIEKNVKDLEKEIDADHIFDCRGRHNRDKNNYDELISPVNSVLLSNRQKLLSDNFNYTKAVATPNGWTFIIPLKDTISYGYLYNDKVTSAQQAEKDFIDRFKISHVKHQIKFENYYAKNMFVGERTILQGNAYGFIEPLEATAVGFYQDLCKQAMRTIFNNHSISESNNKVRGWMKQIETFLLWHYQFGSQYDTPFWDYAKSLPFEMDDQFKYIMKNLDSDKRYYSLSASSFKNWYNGVK